MGNTVFPDKEIKRLKITSFTIEQLNNTDNLYTDIYSIKH